MDEQKQSELMLANQHASVTLSSLAYDPAEDNLLVAALTEPSATELLSPAPSLVSCDWFYVIATADQRGDVPVLLIG